MNNTSRSLISLSLSFDLLLHFFYIYIIYVYFYTDTFASLLLKLNTSQKRKDRYILLDIYHLKIANWPTFRFGFSFPFIFFNFLIRFSHHTNIHTHTLEIFRLNIAHCIYISIDIYQSRNFFIITTDHRSDHPPPQSILLSYSYASPVRHFPAIFSHSRVFHCDTQTHMRTDTTSVSSYFSMSIFKQTFSGISNAKTLISTTSLWIFD